MLLLAAAAASAGPRFVAFGPHGREWLLVEVNTRRIQRVALPTDNIEGLAVSPDGTRFAYVVRRPDGSSGVWFWRRGAGEPRLLESGPGRYSDPAISPDGRIYYSASPVNGVRHTFGTYAQVFAIGPDGGGRKQMTDGEGCHFGTSFTAQGQMQYIHSSCTTRTWVERIGQEERPMMLADVTGSMAEAVSSSDGRSLLLVRDQPDSIVIEQVSEGKPPRLLFAIGHRNASPRAAYGRTRDEIFFQRDGAVWVWRHGTMSLVARMEREAAQ